MHRKVLLVTAALAPSTLPFANLADASSNASQAEQPEVIPTPEAPDLQGFEGAGSEVPLVASAPGATPASAAGPAAVSPAGCVARIDDAHIATSVPGAVKVNASITCARPVQSLLLQVNLYKKIFFGLLSSLQATTTASNAGRASLQNQNTFRRCTNRKSTDWFGTAFARSIEGGTAYSARVRSPHTRTLNCGT